jgi:hypothetical protein
MQFASRMPTVVDIWNEMLSAPRQVTGATSLRYMGTDCAPTLALSLSGSFDVVAPMLQGKMHRMWRHAGGLSTPLSG